MSNIPDEKMAACHGIIHTAATATAGVGAGLAQIPGSDNAVIIPIQAGMIVGLATVFGKLVTKETAIAAMGTQAASLIGRGISQVLVGWIPGIGNALNATTAFGITEALGWFVAEMLSSIDGDKSNLSKEDLEEMLKNFKKD